ncbi:MAG: hypothetical protein WBC51_10515 [Vicinamibacterales bacterium]
MRVTNGARIALLPSRKAMIYTDGLTTDSPAQGAYAFRLGRAVLMLALGAAMHLPSAAGPGLLAPAVSPRPFVRVAAQQADATVAPAVIVDHSLVYATLPATDGVLQVNNTVSETPLGTAGVGEAPRALGLAELQPRHAPSVALTDEPKRDEPGPNAVPDAPEPITSERPLPAVAMPPANDPPPPPHAPSAAAVNMGAPPPTYRPAPIASTARGVSEEQEEQLVRQLLDEYTGAFERLDVRATKALYPNVDGRKLKRAFEQITSQRLTLESCGITISGSTANARCRGSATFQPRIGTRPVQVASREWMFDLSKQDTSWRIVNTYVR